MCIAPHEFGHPPPLPDHPYVPSLIEGMDGAYREMIRNLELLRQAREAGNHRQQHKAALCIKTAADAYLLANKTLEHTDH